MPYAHTDRLNDILTGKCCKQSSGHFTSQLGDSPLLTLAQLKIARAQSGITLRSEEGDEGKH
jgi:hypothetical protein